LWVTALTRFSGGLAVCVVFAQGVYFPLYTYDRKLNTDRHNAEVLVLPRTHLKPT
jgi:hypothetical protein